MGFNDIYRLKIHQRLHGQEVINVLHFKEDAPLGGVGAQALADDFRTNMQTTMRARSTNELVYEYVEVIPLIPTGEEPKLSLWPANTLGTLGGGTGTGSVAEVVTLYTGQAGRRKRGRIYLAGGNTGSMIQGQWTLTQTNATTAFITALGNRYAKIPYTTSWVLGVWSRMNGNQHPPYNTAGFTPVQVLTIRTTIRNQRRRQLGVGR